MFEPVGQWLTIGSESKYLDNDSVFAVKDALVVKFEPRKDDPQAEFDLKYDVQLAPADEEGGSGVPDARPAF